MAAAGSVFANVTLAPPDPILGTTTAFNNDTDPRKVNLGVGAYRTEQGKPYVLDVVREAEAEILAELGTGNNKEYSPIDGPADLKTCCRMLGFGDDSPAVKEDRVASVQALSGTGALRVVGEFIKTHLSSPAHTIWISDPTWGNHPTIFKTAGLTVQTYPYWDATTRGLNIEGMIDALENKAAEGNSVLLHACAHNPTGVDPTPDQWRRIAEVMKRRQLIPIMDNAYQGYASGDLEKDAFAQRLFANELNFDMFMCQSFAKNLGLYGERVGMVHVVCPNADQQKAVTSQLKMVIRPMYSSPPIHGALLVMKIVGNPERYNKWKVELKSMADRVLEVRSLLRSGLEGTGAPGTWNHLTDQIGMFSFTGLKPDECQRLMDEHHIYLLKSGRISMAGLNKANVPYMVDCVDEVIRFCNK
jgi:aspartate aminotransferase